MFTNTSSITKAINQSTGFNVMNPASLGRLALNQIISDVRAKSRSNGTIKEESELGPSLEEEDQEAALIGNKNSGS